MSTCILTFPGFVLGLFVFKLLYVLATAVALPVTRGALFTSTAQGGYAKEPRKKKIWRASKPRGRVFN